MRLFSKETEKLSKTSKDMSYKLENLSKKSIQNKEKISMKNIEKSTELYNQIETHMPSLTYLADTLTSRVNSLYGNLINEEFDSEKVQQISKSFKFKFFRILIKIF